MLKVELRNSRANDVDMVLAFYDASRHPNMITRHRDIIAAQVEARRFILVEGQDQDDFDDHALIGAAGLFPFQRSVGYPDGGAEPPWREIGAARILLNGFGLHKLLIAARVAHDLALSPGAESQFSVLYEHDVVATATHITAGFTPWTPPTELVEQWLTQTRAMAEVSEFGLKGYQFLALPRVAASQLIYYLMRCDTPDFMLVRPASRQHGAAKAAYLRLSLDCLRSHFQELNQLAQVDAVHGRLQSVQALGERGGIL